MFDRDNAHRRTGAAAALILLMLSAFHGHASEPDDDDPADQVIALVNGTELTLGDFNAFINTRIGKRRTNLSSDQVNTLFSEYINRELVFQDAAARGWDSSPEIELALENHRRNIVARHAFSQLLKTPIPGEAVEKAYRDLRPVREYRISHILTDTQDGARQILADLEQGGSFEALATERSIDSSAADGGHIGWISADQLSPPLREAATSLRAGRTAAEPIQTDYGWHVLRVEETRIVPVPPLEDVRDELRAQLANQRIVSYISELRESGDIEIRR